MEIKDLLKNLHLIEIRTRKKMQGGLASSYRNVFRGQGLEFSEVREYVEGDDIRLIDWNVSARFRNLYVKQLMEERELNIITALQASRSMDFGTTDKTKFQAAAEVAATVIFSALHTGDRPGLVLYGGGGAVDYVAPKKGTHHGFVLLHKLLDCPLAGDAPETTELMKFLTHGLKKRSVVFLIGDFIYSEWDPDLLEMAARRHDLIGVALLDPTELAGPSGGIVRLEGRGLTPRPVSASGRARDRYRERVQERLAFVRGVFQKARADFLLLQTDSPYEQELHQLFMRRIASTALS